MSRTGSVTVGSDGFSRGIAAFEVGQSNSSLWSAFIRNGAGAAQALRVKGGFFNATDPVFQVEANSADPNWTNAQDNFRFRVQANGYVGVNSFNPIVPLDVCQSSSNYAHGAVAMFRAQTMQSSSDNGGNFLKIIPDNDAFEGTNGLTQGDDISILFDDQKGNNSDNSTAGLVIGPQISTFAKEGIRITATGNVGIGTSMVNNPNNYKLGVSGVIGCQGINIENTSTTWSDYVFDPNYSLLALDTLERFIKEKKHLPEVPTACDVADKGINIAEMESTLLKKVEELTLYTIKLNKQNEELKTRLSKLENQKN